MSDEICEGVDIFKEAFHHMSTAHLYILYLVEKPCRFFSTKSMYSGEWWKGPLSERSQSRGPPGLSLGRLAGAAVAVAQGRKHTQQWRLRLMMPHRAISDRGRVGGKEGWRLVVMGDVQQTNAPVISWLVHWDNRGTCITSMHPKRLEKI